MDDDLSDYLDATYGDGTTDGSTDPLTGLAMPTTNLLSGLTAMSPTTAAASTTPAVTAPATPASSSTGFLGTLSSLFGQASTAYTQVTGAPLVKAANTVNAQAATTAAPAAAPATSTNTLYLVGAAILVLFGFFYFKRR